MKAWGRLAGSVVVAVALWAAPAHAARPSPIELLEWPDGLTELRFHGSDGYDIELMDTGQRTISLTARKGQATVTYVVRGEKTTRGGIDATFPGVGRIRVAFRQVGPARRGPLPDNCRGEGNLIRRGVFVGTIRFSGERGYTRVGLHRARGEVIQPPQHKQRCDYDNGKSGGRAFHGFQVTSLDAFAARGRGVRGVFVTKFGSAPGLEAGGTVFAAISTSSRAGMVISRLVSARAGTRSLVLGGDGKLPSTATISPPAPFAGTATYERPAGGPATWTGSLSVEFPGTVPISLAGPAFKPSLCVDSKCATEKSGTGRSIAVVAGQ